jgi:hypothetical protein
MKFNAISIPGYLLYESRTRNKNLIRSWIEFRNNESIHNKLLGSQRDIPEELFYPGSQTDINRGSNISLVTCIRYRKNEPIRDRSLEPRSDIPEELK